MQKVKKIRRIHGPMLITFLGLVLFICLYASTRNTVTGNRQPSIFGYSMAAIVSGSMSGTIEVDDLVVIHQEEAYEIGDIISYDDGNVFVVHRIIRKEDDSFITKGDANNTEDPEPVMFEDITGKVVAVIPKLGGVTQFLRRSGEMICLMISGLILIEVLYLLKKQDTKKSDKRRK